MMVTVKWFSRESAIPGRSRMYMMFSMTAADAEDFRSQVELLRDGSWVEVA